LGLAFHFFAGALSSGATSVVDNAGCIRDTRYARILQPGFILAGLDFFILFR
jgi:hypothetical protein